MLRSSLIVSLLFVIACLTQIIDGLARNVYNSSGNRDISTPHHPHSPQDQDNTTRYQDLSQNQDNNTKNQDNNAKKQDNNTKNQDNRALIPVSVDQVPDQSAELLDSLLRALEGSTGFTRIHHLLNISNWYASTDGPLAVQYALKAFELAGSYELDSIHARCLYTLGCAYYMNNQMTEAESSLNEALKFYTGRKNHMREAALTYFKLGSVYKHLSRFAQSILTYEDGYELVKRMEDKRMEAEYLQRMANIHKHLGEYDLALELVFKSIEICSENGYNVILSACYNDIGHIYNKIEKYDEAVHYFRLSVTSADETHNLWMDANSLTGMGEAAKKRGAHDSALNFYLQALDKRQQLQDPTPLIYNYINIGFSYIMLDDYSLASEYLDTSLLMAQETQNDFLVATTLLGMGMVEDRKGNRSRSLELLHNALDLSRKTEAHPLELRCLESIYLVYEKMGNYSRSFQYLKLYRDLSAHLYSEKSSTRTEELRTRYRTKAMEDEILLLEKENTIKDLEVEKYRRRIVIYILLFGFAMIAAAFGFFMWSQKERINKLIRKQNVELDRLNHQLSELNNTKDKFFSIVAHDLKGPISSIWGYAELLKTQEKLDDQKKRMYQEFIFESIHDVSELLENLLEWSRFQRDTMRFEKRDLNLAELIDKNIGFIKSAAEKKQISITADTDTPVMVSADNQMINSVLRNLINNAVKFTPEKGTLKITTREDLKMVNVSVKDSGIGMDQDTIDKLFHLDKPKTSKGTAGETGTGLGLVICKDFVDKHDGSLHIESEPGKGSTFTFSIPKS